MDRCRVPIVGVYDEGDLIRKEMAGHCFGIRTGDVAGTGLMSKVDTGGHKLLECVAVVVGADCRESLDASF